MLNIFIMSSFLFLTLILPNLWTSVMVIFSLLTIFSLFMIYSPMLDISFSSNLLMLDPMSSSLITLTLWIAFLMIIASYKINTASLSQPKFSLMIIILSMILISSFALSNFMLFYIMFEASLIPTFLLIMGWGYQPERLQASMYLLLYTICASLPLLINLSLIYFEHGALQMTNMYLIHNISSSSFSWWILSILAFMVKMPMYFVHLWLPKAHVEAPVAGSMVLAGILLKLGSYGLIRMSAMFQPLSFLLAPMFTSIAIWGGAITSFICMRQADIKSLIAYSSVGHMALVVMGAMLCSSWGWSGALIMMIAHGLCSSCMFALANMTYEATNSRSMFLTKGILSLFPAISMWWLLLSISNMAAPPSINLFGEICLISSALWSSFFLMIPIGICSFLACAYSLYLYTSTNHGNNPSFLNPLPALNNAFYSACAMHFIPIWALILKPEIVSSWL